MGKVNYNLTITHGDLLRSGGLRHWSGYRTRRKRVGIRSPAGWNRLASDRIRPESAWLPSRGRTGWGCRNRHPAVLHESARFMCLLSFLDCLLFHFRVKRCLWSSPKTVNALGGVAATQLGLYFGALYKSLAVPATKNRTKAFCCSPVSGLLFVKGARLPNYSIISLDENNAPVCKHMVTHNAICYTGCRK
jgi:hypothetical protein